DVVETVKRAPPIGIDKMSQYFEIARLGSRVKAAPVVIGLRRHQGPGGEEHVDQIETAELRRPIQRRCAVPTYYVRAGSCGKQHSYDFRVPANNRVAECIVAFIEC